MNEDARELRAQALERIEARATRELNDQSYNWIRSPGRRRTLALITFLSALGFGAGVMVDHGGVIGAMLVLYAACLYLGRRATRGITDLPDELLDERHRAGRNRAYRLGFVTYLATLSCVFVAATCTYKLAGLTATPDHMIGALLGLFALGLAMPAMAYAWTERIL